MQSRCPCHSSFMVNTDKVMNFFLAFTFLWLWANAIHIKGFSHSLKPGDALNHLDELCSSSSNYCLCFVEFVGSDFSFLQIHDATDSLALWTANRDLPVLNFSGVLTLDYSGTLKITRQDEEPIILYSSTQATNISSIATLSDNGNFVLQELNPDGSVKSMLWQSFDYPTNIFVPGMKLGVNHKTGHSWLLVSYASDEIPVSGTFTLEWEPTSAQLIIRRRGQIYWASGTLRNNKFEWISEQVQDMYQYTIVSNEDEDSFTYTAQNDEQVRWALYDSGQLTDGKGNAIARADECYGYNTDGGCQTWNIPSCRHDGQIFHISTGYLNGDYNLTMDFNASSTESDCEAACWSNCDCVGFLSTFDNKTGCVFLHGDSWGFINNADGESFHKIVTKSSDHKGKGVKKWMWVGAVIATVLFIFSVGTICLIQKIRKEKEKTMETERKLRVFSYASVMEATNGFSSENKLGEGGFGSVYKGKLQMDIEVAIKRLSKCSRQGASEFKNELRLISELQHINLVQLLGYCIHGNEKMLIYEYMPNKSLDFFLFDSFQGRSLDWKKRFNIIEGVAQGLLYLHRYSRLRVIHRDLKAGNILLDVNMNPKISDFGMARICTQASEGNSTRIAGTFGYMSPECITNQVYSVKSDVYSFGVLMLEIVSGKRNNRFGALVRQAWELWREGMVLKLLDPAINHSFAQDQTLKCIHVAFLCLEELAFNRPNMSEIVSMLTNENATLPLPQNPAFDIGARDNVERNETPAEHNTDTRNGLTISNMSAR